MEPNETPNDVTGLEESRLYAALSYIFILVFVPLLTRKNDPYVSYHARQGLVVFLGYIISAIASFWVPVLGNIFGLLLILISIFGVVQAVQGKRWHIPVITDIANKFSI